MLFQTHLVLFFLWNAKNEFLNNFYATLSILHVEQKSVIKYHQSSPYEIVHTCMRIIFQLYTQLFKSYGKVRFFFKGMKES